MSTPIISPPSPKPNKIIRNPIFDTSKRSDCELGIFDAEKYYKAELNIPPLPLSPAAAHHGDSRKRSLSVLSYKKKSVSGSSISSMNSRSFLLHSREESERKTILASAATVFGKCCCRGKNSVDAIAGNSIKRSETKTPVDCQSGKMGSKFENPGLRINCISFPIQNPTTGKQVDAGGIHRRIWSHDKMTENSISTGDSDTDSSSDLFEIDIPSGNCYPPSEASIEWSVVTASAAEISIVSDSDELRQKVPFSPPKTKLEASKTGLLSACRNEKAVGVVENAHRTQQSFRKSHEEKKLKRESFDALHQIMV